MARYSWVWLCTRPLRNLPFNGLSYQIWSLCVKLNGRVANVPAGGVSQNLITSSFCRQPLTPNISSIYVQNFYNFGIIILHTFDWSHHQTISMEVIMTRRRQRKPTCVIKNSINQSNLKHLVKHLSNYEHLYRHRRLRFSSDADIVRLTNARIIIIIIIITLLRITGQFLLAPYCRKSSNIVF